MKSSNLSSCSLVLTAAISSSSDKREREKNEKEIKKKHTKAIDIIDGCTGTKPKLRATPDPRDI